MKLAAWFSTALLAACQAHPPSNGASPLRGASDAPAVERDAHADVREDAQRLLDESRTAQARGDVAAARGAIGAAVDALLALSDVGHDDAYLPLLDQCARQANIVGDPSAARRAFERALAMREATRPADDLDLARTRVRLALEQCDLGAFEAARTLFDAGVPVLASRLGDEEREVQSALSNQAVLLRALQDDAAARILLARVLAVRERTLPPDHVDLQRSRFNLAVALDVRRDLDRKRELLASATEVVDRTLPPEDSLVLAVHLANATVAQDAGDLVGARAEYERLLAVYSRTLPPTDPHRLNATLALCTVLRALLDYRGARELGEQLLATVEQGLPPDHPEVFRAREQQARTLTALGDLRGARALLEPLLADLERTQPPDDLRTEGARTQLADVLLRERDLSRAKELAQAILDARESRLPSDDLLVGQARAQLGSILLEAGDLAGALELLESALAVEEKALAPEDEQLLLLRMQYANALRERGELARAGEILSSIVDTLERAPGADPSVLLMALGNRSLVLQDSGDLRAAREVQERVLEAFEKTCSPDDQMLITARANLGWLLARMGDLGGARALMERALEARERTCPPDDYALQNARANLAGVLASMGDLPAARALLEKALAGYERTLDADHSALLNARQNLSSILEGLGDLDAARTRAEQVLAARERTLPEEHHDTQTARIQLAQILARLGEHDRARALDEIALAHLENTLQSGDPDLESVRLGLAAEWVVAGDLGRARALQEEALRALRQYVSADHPILRATTIELAWTLVRLGDRDGARIRAKELARDALAAVRSALVVSPREASERWTALHDDASAAASLALALEPDRELDELVFGLFEEIRSASQQALVPLDDRDDPALRAQLERDADLRGRIHDAIAARGAAVQPIADLVRERDAAEAELRRLSIARGLRSPEIHPADLSRALASDACAVGYARYDRSRIENGATIIEPCLLVHVVDLAGRIERIELGPMAPIENAVDAWREGVGHPLGARGLGIGAAAPSSAERERAAARTLHALVLEPVLRKHPTMHTMHVCLDDALQLVAFDALLLDGGVQPCEVRVEVSLARLLAPPPPVTADPRLCALGGVDYDAELGPRATHSSVALAPPLGIPGTRRGERADDGWPPLAGTETEARSIAKRFAEVFGREAVLLFGASASKSALEEATRGARFVHIATHGYFTDESSSPAIDDARSAASTSRMTRTETVRGLAPMTLCGLALAGANRGMDDLGHVPGVITAEEIAGLDLSHCELAVLSACETHVGITRAGQGVQSLQAALHAAGARTAITSLWKVDDEATRALFEDFYARIWSGHEKKSDALWHAKMALRATGHPTRDWAAWVLTGDCD